jgi:hypothetical protein
MPWWYIIIPPLHRRRGILFYLCSSVLVHKNQLSRQTGSRKLTGPKTLPTILHTNMKLVTKYQISAINSCWEKCDENNLFTGGGVYCFTSVRPSFRPSKIIFVAFFSATIDGRNLIFGHQLHIGNNIGKGMEHLKNMWPYGPRLHLLFPYKRG